MARYVGTPFKTLLNTTPGERETMRLSNLGSEAVKKRIRTPKGGMDLLDAMAEMAKQGKGAPPPIENVAGFVDDVGTRFAPDPIGRAVAGAAEVNAERAGLSGLISEGAAVAPEIGLWGGRLGTALKVGGGVLGGVGALLMAIQLLKQFKEETSGHNLRTEAGKLLGADEMGNEAGALGYEKGIAGMLNANDAVQGSAQLNSQQSQMEQERELMALVADRGQELQAISERYRPSLAERMARMGVL